MISPRRRRFSARRTLVRTGFALLCVVSLLIALGETPFGRQWLREQLAGVIRSELGLEARIGSIRLEPTLLPPSVAIVAHGIELDHPTEGRLVVASRLEVQPSFTSLLVGRVDLRRIALRNPHVRLVVRDGRLANGPTTRSRSSGDSSELPFRYVALEGGVVRVVGDAPVTGVLRGISAEIGAGGGRAMSVDVRVDDGLVYHPRGQEHIDLLVIEGAVDLDHGIHVSRVRAITDSVRIALRHGSVPLPWDERASGAIDARIDVNRLGALVAEDLGVTLSGIVDVHGTASFDHERFGANAHLVLHGFGIEGKKIGEPLELDVVVDETEARIVRGTMHMPHGAGSVGLRGRIGLATPFPIEAALDFRRMDLAALLDEIDVTDDAIVRWYFTGPASLRGQIVPFHLAGPIDVESTDFFVSAGPWHREPRERILGVPHGHIRGRADIDARGLGFYDLDVVTEYSRIAADAWISFSDSFEVRATSDHLDLADISPLTTFPLTGVGSIDVHVGGLYADPVLDATGFMRGFSFDGLPLGDLELAADFEEGGLVAHFPQIRAIHGDSRYVVNDLRLDFTEHLEVDAGIELETVTLADLYRTFHLDEDERFDAYAAIGHGNVRAHFTYGFPDDGPSGTVVTDIDVALDRANLAGYAFEDGRFRGQLRWYDLARGFDGAELDVDEFTLRKGAGTLALAGTIAEDGVLDLDVVADRIAIEDTEDFGVDWPLLTGTYGVIGSISNTLALPHMDLDVALSDFAWGGRTIGDGRAYVKLTDGTDPYVTSAEGLDPDHAPAGEHCIRARQALLHADWPPDPPAQTPEGPVEALDRPEAFLVCGEGLGGALDLDVALGFTDVGPHRGRITFRDFDLSPFLGASGDADAPRGSVSGSIDLTNGDVSTDRTTTGSVRIDSLSVRAGGVDIRNRDPWLVSLVRGTARFDRATLVGNGTELALSGTASSTELALALDGRVGMDLFAAASPALASATGTTDLRILVRGPIADPEVVGEAVFADVSVEHASLPVPISDVSGRIEFSERRIAIDGITGKIGTGTIAIDGSAAIEGAHLQSVELHTEIANVSLQPEDGLEVAFGGALDATWDASRTLPLVRGTLDLQRVRYTRPIQVTPTLGELYRPARTEVDSYDPANEFVELDIQLVERAPIEVRNNLVDLDIAIADDERPFRIVGTNERLGALGTLAIPRGQIFFRGQSFDVRRGTIELDDRTRIHPRFDVLAQTEIRRNYDSTAPAFRIQLAATGDSDGFRLDASSTPNLSQQDIMLLIVVGMTSSELQNLQASQLSSAALDALSTLTGVQDRLSAALRVVDEVSLTTTYHPVTNRPEPQLTVGSRITDRVRVTASTGLTSETRSIRTTAQIRLDDHTSVQAVYDNQNRDTASAFGNLGVDVRYRLEFE